MKDIGITINALNKFCENMRQHVALARQENAPVLEDASALLDQRREVETKKQLLEAFNEHFIMSEEDLFFLKNLTEDVDEKFFAILKRVKQIYADCQILLGSENQRLGLELMDQSSKNLNAGYQKLYRWIQKEFKTLNLENPQISSIIRRALRALAERPTLFQSCLDFFSEAREHILSDAFYTALTGPSAENEQNLMTKPIEFYAHDPLRYIGDMLAWMHSATVSEREALEALFISEGEEMSKGFQAGRKAEPWSADDAEAFDGRKALQDLVNRNMSGVARVLRQRIEQVLQNHEDAVLMYKMANLVNFYRITFDKLLGSESSLLETLYSLEESALRQFRDITSENVSSIQAGLPMARADLRTPDFLDESLTNFSALLKSYESSLTPAASRTADFEPVLSQALNPFLLSCEKMTKEMDEPEKSIYLMNCILAAKATLGRHDFVQDRVSELDEQLESYAFTLTEYQYAFLLHSSGLHPLLTALAPLDDAPDSLLKIPTLPPFKRQALIDASQALDEFLPSALIDAMDNLKYLSDTRVAQEITAEAVERFCEDFEFVEGRLRAVDALREDERDGMDDSEDQGGKEPLRNLLPRTTGEIRVLLS